MTIQIQTRRSSLLNDRPVPTRIASGELCVNINSGDPGLFFADNVASPSTGLIKVGPIHVGSTQPNNIPTGFSSFSKGESWLGYSKHTFYLEYTMELTGSMQRLIASTTNSGFPSNPVNGQLHYHRINNYFTYL